MKEFYVVKIENSKVVAFGVWQDTPNNRKRLEQRKKYGFQETKDQYIEAWDDNFYKESEVPEKSSEIKKEEIRKIRSNRYFIETDPIKHKYDEAMLRGNLQEAEALKEQWLAAKDKIRNELPYN